MIKLKDIFYYGKSLRRLVICVMAIIAIICWVNSFAQLQSDQLMAESFMQQFGLIMEAAEKLAKAKGSYVDGGVSTGSVAQILPSGTMKTPWGSDISISDVTSGSFNINFANTPQNVCKLLQSKILNLSFWVPYFKINENCTQIAYFFLASQKEEALSKQRMNMESFLGQIQGIILAADQLAAKGSYVGGGVNTNSVAQQVPPGYMKTAWGGDIAIADVTDKSFNIVVSMMPENVCKLLQPKILNNTNFKMNEDCTKTTYTANVPLSANPWGEQSENKSFPAKQQVPQSTDQVYDFTSKVNAIVYTADLIAERTGSYVGGGVSTDSVASLVAVGGMQTSWGAVITISGVTDASFNIVISNVPENVCQLSRPKMLSNPRLKISEDCRILTYSKSG